MLEIKPQQSSFKANAIFYFGALLIAVILINIITSKYFFRLDLTEEKRYTLSEASKEVLKNLDDVVYVEVYLEGEFPAGFKRLQRAIKETLNEFRIYGSNKVQFKFIDPNAETDPNKLKQFHYQLVQKGIQPTNLFANEGDKKVEKLLFPGATVSYGSREVGVILLKGNSASSAQERLNQSIENVEYELISAIKEMTTAKRKKIGLLTGNLELDSIQTLDISSELAAFYQVQPVNIRNVPFLDGYDAVVIAKPQKPFNDDEKLKLDQYVVNGGRLLWFVDALRINLDSLGENGAVAVPYQLNLEDLFFKWGVRMEQNYVQDLTSGALPMNVGTMGDKPQFQLVPWRYHPLLNTYAKNPIVRNLDAIYSRFIGTIDTVKATGITKTPLIFTSKYSRVLAAPIHVALDEMRKEITPEMFNKSFLPVCYLLEGKFKSNYASRPLFVEKYPGIVNQNKTSKMIICADGDIIANEFDFKSNKIIPVGFDRFMRKKFANRDFVLNSISYLLDDKGLINVRSKEITLRPLDKLKIKEEKKYWQFINLVLPVITVIILGVIRYQWRKRKYEKMP